MTPPQPRPVLPDSPFVKWMLGVTASLVVAIGASLLGTINQLRDEVAGMRKDIQYTTQKLVEFNYEIEQSSVTLKLHGERIMRLETRHEISDNARSNKNR